MNPPAHAIPTAELWDQLFKTPDLPRFLGENPAEVGLPSFADYLTQLCALKKQVPGQVIRRTALERSFGHQVFRGSRRPSRDTVIQLAFGLGLEIAQAQALLRHGGFGPLYPRLPRDLAIGYCLHHRMDLTQAQAVLEELGLPPIGSGGRK